MLQDMRPIRALIVDDEPLARQIIRSLLASDPEVVVMGECSNGAQAIEVMTSEKPDLVFLDVQMPEKTGLEVLKEVGPDQMPVVIFTTAYDRYALKAFEVQALDYLLKPFDDERFESAVNRAKKQVRQKEIGHLSQKLFSLLDHTGLVPSPTTASPPQQAEKTDASPYLHRIMIKGSGPIFFLKVEEIDWIEAADYYAELHVGDQAHLLRESLKSLEDKLNPAHFMRIHRSTIVNLDRIHKLQPDARGDYQVILRDGGKLRLGRGKKDELQSRLMGIAPES